MAEKLKLTETAQTISNGYLQNCKGKTIADFEYGTVEPSSERIILRFTDGGKLTIDIGSNINNVAMEHKGLKPEDFRTDLIAIYTKDGKS
jgi:hypothetical protein